MSHITESHFTFSSVPGAFDSALSPGASQYADLTVGGSSQAANSGASGGPVKTFINSVLLLSKEDLKWRVEFHRKTLSNVVNTASYFPSNLIGWTYVQDTGGALPANWTGAGVANATPYGTMFASFISGLNIPYEDADGNGQVHVNVVNLAGQAKSAGTAGYLYLSVGTIAAS